jgi:hypothetical protein
MIDLLVEAELAPPNPAYLAAVKRTNPSHKAMGLFNGEFLSIYTEVHGGNVQDPHDAIRRWINEAIHPLGGRIVVLSSVVTDHLPWKRTEE